MEMKNPREIDTRTCHRQIPTVFFSYFHQGPTCLKLTTSGEYRRQGVTIHAKSD